MTFTHYNKTLAEVSASYIKDDILIKARPHILENLNISIGEEVNISNIIYLTMFGDLSIQDKNETKLYNFEDYRIREIQKQQPHLEFEHIEHDDFKYDYLDQVEQFNELHSMHHAIKVAMEYEFLEGNYEHIIKSIDYLFGYEDDNRLYTKEIASWCLDQL